MPFGESQPYRITPLLFAGKAHGLSRILDQGLTRFSLKWQSVHFFTSGGVAVWIIEDSIPSAKIPGFSRIAAAAVTMASGFNFFDYHLHPKDLSNSIKHPIL